MLIDTFSDDGQKLTNSFIPIASAAAHEPLELQIYHLVFMPFAIASHSAALHW